MRSTSLALAIGFAAACTGPTYDTGPQFTPDPPSVYVAKVKNILVGLAPSDDEIAAVVKDPNALPGLIDQWMALPEYQQKMMVFFELAFQQTQITQADFVDIAPPNGLGNGRALPLVVQNARESFARTVLALNASGHPLTDAFTTHQIMMTPALMQLYAYLDDHAADNNGAINDAFAIANPTLTFTMTATGTMKIPLAQSIDATNQAGNYMHWWNPDVATTMYPDPTCNGLDPITIPMSSFSLFEILYGEIPAHKTPAGVFCPIRGGTGMGLQLDPTDFTTWKMVTIRAPRSGEATTRFFDLLTMRSSNELVLKTPRVGFYTTLAFFANWPTNASNEMRVTTNQALIVATGTAIDGTDGTIPASTPGLDAQHAAPGTACFGCHQLLDPTRSILSSTYSWFYNPQTIQKWYSQPGLFAFQHVIAPMASIDDFGKLLATHPLMPGAWGQKLCYYVNSAPCDPNDTEFQRIVADFAGGTSWNALVREVLSSPITTNTARTKTYETNGEVIAVSRRDHLCAALNNRLGFVDICQLDAANQKGALSTIAQIVSGMPSDGYGRGGTIPVLPNQPTLFYRGGLENICSQVSGMVIDAAANPKQPGAKKWSSSQPDAAIADFVSIVMGLTASDPRASAVTTALKDHFTAAQQQAGASATDALRSTFVAACLSPGFIGIGM
jgi:hypothetical protein